MPVIGLVQLLFDLYVIILLARVLLSWIKADPHNPLVRIARLLTEPLVAPIRRMLPPGDGLDLSPMIAFVGVLIVEQIVLTLLSSALR